MLIARQAGDWLLPGLAHGLRHPPLHVPLRLQADAPVDLTPLRERVDAWVVDPHPPAPAPAAQLATPHGAGTPGRLLHLLHDTCQALLREQGIAVFGPCAVLRRAAGDDGRAGDWLLALPSVDRVATLAALDWVLEGANLLFGQAPATPEALVAWEGRLADLRGRLRLRGQAGINPIRFAEAGYRLDLPMTPIAPGITMVGLGRASRWLNSSLTDATPGLGVSLARRKDTSAALLRHGGLPLPPHRRADSADAAVEVARALGYPVVVKPADRDQGQGVFAHLTDDEQVRRAHDAARQVSNNILVERFVFGDDYRLGIAFGRVVQVLHRRAAHVSGDGRSSIAELVAAVQQQPDQLRAFRRTGRWRVELDAEALELLSEQSLRPDAVLAVGRVALLRRKANVSSGGVHRLVPLAEVHPDNVAMALRAAALLRLDMAGVDFISPDIALPWHANGGAICEINAQPQFGARDTPELHALLLRELVGDVEVPVHVLLLDGEDPAPTAEALAAMATELGCNAWSGPGQGWVDGRQVGFACRHSIDAAWTVLMDRGTAGALLVLLAQDVLRQGLPVGRLHSLRVALDADGRQARTPLLRQALAVAAPHALRVLAWQDPSAGAAASP